SALSELRIFIFISQTIKDRRGSRHRVRSWAEHRGKAPNCQRESEGSGTTIYEPPPCPRFRARVRVPTGSAAISSQRMQEACEPLSVTSRGGTISAQRSMA